MTEITTPTRRYSGWPQTEMQGFLKDKAIRADMSVLSLHSEEGINKAAELVKGGAAIAGHNLGVNFIFGDASNPAFINSVIAIKGEARITKPMGTCFDAHTLVDMIDMTHIPPQLVPVFSNPRLLEQTFGSLTFLRLHITEEAVRKYQLPEAVLSGNRQKGEAILQNWLTHGNLAMSALGSKMKEKGVTIPAITSLNKSGQGETVHQEDGIVFSSENNIPLFLFDEQLPPLYKVNDQVDFAIGSNPILSFDKDGVYIDRQGYQNPAFWLPFIGEHYSVSITDKSLAPHRYPQIIIPQDLLDGLVGARNPRIVQMGILRYMLGISKENILKKFKAKNG